MPKIYFSSLGSDFDGYIISSFKQVLSLIVVGNSIFNYFVTELPKTIGYASKNGDRGAAPTSPYGSLVTARHPVCNHGASRQKAHIANFLATRYLLRS